MLRFVSYGLYCEQILAKCSKVFFLAVRNNSYWLHFSLRPSSDAVARKKLFSAHRLSSLGKRLLLLLLARFPLANFITLPHT